MFIQHNTALLFVLSPGSQVLADRGFSLSYSLCAYMQRSCIVLYMRQGPDPSTERETSPAGGVLKT